MKIKECPICKESKPIKQYYKYFSKKRNKYRISNYCKPCARENSNARSKKHFQENREKKLKYAKDYRVKNKEKVKEHSTYFTKKYREELKECYVAEFAAKSLKCSTKEIHNNPQLMQAYKSNMKLKRLIRKNNATK